MACPIDSNGLAGKVLTSISNQEHSEVSQFVHFTVAPHGHAGNISRFALSSCFRPQSGPRTLCWKWSRRNGVEANTVFGPFHGKGFSHCMDPSFRHGRWYNVRTARPYPGHQDGDHAADEFLLYPSPTYRMGGIVGPMKDSRCHSVKTPRRQLIRGAHDLTRGIIYQSG